MTTHTVRVDIKTAGAKKSADEIEGVGKSAKKAARDLDEANKAIKRTSGNLDTLKRGLGLVTAGLGVREIVRYADAWKSAAGKINVVTRNSAEAAVVQERLYKTAQDSRQSYTLMAQLYARVGMSAKELGASQEDLLQMVNNVGKAIAVQGATAEEVRAVMIQLAQGLGSGIFRGEEFRSVMEGIPYILQLVAGSMGKTTEELRQMMLKGDLTSKAFLENLNKAAETVGTAFGKTSKTFGQSMNVLQNGLIRFIGKTEESLGVLDKFYELSKFISDHMPEFASAIAGLSVSFALAGTSLQKGLLTGLVSIGSAVKGIPALFMAATVVIKDFFLAFKANPAMSFAISLAGLKNAFKSLGATVLSVLTGALKVFFTFISKNLIGILVSLVMYIQTADNKFAEFGRKLISSGIAAVGETVGKAWDFATEKLGGFFNTFADAMTLGQKTFDGFCIAITTGWKAAMMELEIWAKTACNEVISGFEGVVNSLNSLIGKSAVSFQKYDVTSLMLEQGDMVKNAYKTAEAKRKFDQMQEFSGGEKVEIAKNLKAPDLNTPLGEAVIADTTSSKPFGGRGKGKGGSGGGRSEVDQFQSSLQRLLDTLDPVGASVAKLREEQGLLTTAFNKGVIDAQQYADYSERLAESYKDQIDPLGRVNRELDESRQLLQMYGDSQKIATEILAIKQDLTRSGIQLTEEETNALREQIQVLLDLERVNRAQNDLLQESVDKRKEFTAQIQAMNALMADPSSGFNAMDQRAALMKMMPDQFAGTETALQAQFDAYAQNFQKIAELRNANAIGEQQYSQMITMEYERMAQGMHKATVEAAKLRNQLGAGDWSTIALASIGQLTDGFTTLSDSMANAFGGMIQTFSQGFSQTISQAIFETKRLDVAIGELARGAVQQLIQQLIQMAIQWLILKAIGFASGGYTGTPGTVGPGGLNYGANISGLPGFASGGFTSYKGVNDIAGVVHGQEFVVNAEATAKNRQTLEAMNRGESIGGNVSVSIQNYGTSKEFDVQQVSETDIRIIARDEAVKIVGAQTSTIIANDLRNPNSPVSRSLSQNTMTERRR